MKEFKGILHTDGYQVYHNLPPDITVVGCWAHARRKFEAIVKNTPLEQRKASHAGQGIAYIDALFSLEKKFSDLSPEERQKKRLEQSKSVADAFFAWAAGLSVLPKTPIGEAVHYAFSQRRYLENNVNRLRKNHRK